MRINRKDVHEPILYRGSDVGRAFEGGAEGVGGVGVGGEDLPQIRMVGWEREGETYGVQECPVFGV